VGGFGSAVAEALDADVVVPVKRIGVPDLLVDHAEPDQSKAALGLTSPQIAEKVLNAFYYSAVNCELLKPTTKDTNRLCVLVFQTILIYLSTQSRTGSFRTK